MNLANLLKLYFKDCGYTIQETHVNGAMVGPVPAVVLGFPKPSIWIVEVPFDLAEKQGDVFVFHSPKMDKSGIRTNPREQYTLARPPPLYWIRLYSASHHVGVNVWVKVGNIHYPDFTDKLGEYINSSIKDGC